MTHEDYVGFEQAQKLKELGFDWECYCAYDKVYKDDRPWGLRNYHTPQNHNLDAYSCSAPTLAQAAKWLREKGIIILIYTLARAKQCVFYWKLYNQKGWQIKVSEDNYDTYEETLSAGIDRALEILKQEKYGNT